MSPIPVAEFVLTDLLEGLQEAAKTEATKNMEILYISFVVRFYNTQFSNRKDHAVPVRNKNQGAFV